MNLEKLIAKNLLRFNVKNLNEAAISKIRLLSEQTQPVSLEKTINFPSGKHSATASNIAGIMDPLLAEIEKFLKTNGASSKIVTIDLQAGESQVPNYDTEVQPKKKLNPGDLSALRYNTIETYMQEKINMWKQSGLLAPDQNVAFNKLDPEIGKTKWAPPANATPAQISKLAASDAYTKEQFMKMYIKVTANTRPVTPEFEKALKSIQTNREAISVTGGNSPFFYGYSRAAATMMGVDYKTLPSQLLTMNAYFANKTPVTVEGTRPILIPKVTFTIKPDGGKEVPLVVSDGKSTLGAGRKWTAKIADTYQIIPNIKPGDPGYEGAWLFAFYYMTATTTQLDDWKRISNKPKDIQFFDIEKLKLVAGPPVGLQSLEGQEKYFEPMGAFANGLVKDKWIVSWQASSKGTFEKLYKEVCDRFLQRAADEEEKESEESEGQ